MRKKLFLKRNKNEKAKKKEREINWHIFRIDGRMQKHAKKKIYRSSSIIDFFLVRERKMRGF